MLKSLAAETTASSARLASLALLCAMLLWASSFIALKIAFRSYDPLVVIFGRMLVASLCFLVVARRLTRSCQYQQGDWRMILLMAFCEPCLYFLFEAKAVENTTASQAGVITAILPIMVMVAAAAVLKERVSPRAWTGALLALVGVLWLTLLSSPTEDAPNPMLGNFLEFLAMVCAACYTIAVKSLTQRYSALFLTAVQAFIGAIFYLPLLFLPSTTAPTAFYPGPAFAIIYLGAAVTLGAYGLYNFSLQYVPANRAAGFVNLIPVFVVLLGWLILGETFTLWQIYAGLLIMAGVYLTQR